MSSRHRRAVIYDSQEEVSSRPYGFRIFRFDISDEDKSAR